MLLRSSAGVERFPNGNTHVTYSAVFGEACSDDLCMVAPLQKTFTTARGMRTSRGRARNAAREERGAWARGRARKAPMGEPGQARAQKSMGWLGLVVAVRQRLVARLKSTLR